MSSTDDELTRSTQAAGTSAPSGAAAPASALDAADRLTADLPCLRCGYHLRGMPPDGQCPECGFAVRVSLEQGFAANPAYTRQLVTGSTLALVAIILGVVLWGAVPTNGFGLATPATEIMLLIVGALLLVTKFGLAAVAAWRLAAPTPVGPGSSVAQTWRRLARGALPVALVCVGMGLCGASGFALWPILAGWSAALLWTFRRRVQAAAGCR